MNGTALEEVRNRKMHDTFLTSTEPTILWGKMRKIYQKPHYIEMVQVTGEWHYLNAISMEEKEVFWAK